MGFFDTIGKLISGETVSFNQTTHSSGAADLVNEGKQSYIGEWTGETTRLLIRQDGTIEYRRTEVVGDSTNTNTVSGPINGFDGASFDVGVMGKNTRFDVTGADGTTMTVNGETLRKG